MADLNVEQHEAKVPEREDDYTMVEVFFWIFGILMIPLVPILMITFFTPNSGM